MAQTYENTQEILDARRAYNETLAQAHDKTRATWFPLLVVALLLAVPALQFVGNYNYVIHMTLYVMMYVTLASGWNVLGGFTGYISLGHSVFFAVGGYFAGMMLARFGISTILMAPLAGLLCGALGYLIGLITLRVRGPSFIISSIALVMIARILFEKWQFVGGAAGLSLPTNDLPVEWAKLPYYYAFLAMAIFGVWASYKIKQSKFGMGLRAISKDEIKAESAGIDTRFYKVLAFAISAFLFGLAGAVWGEYLTYVRPNIFIHILYFSVWPALMCILGGKGTIAGPVVGALLLVAFNEAGVAFFGSSAINIFVTGLIMALTLMFFPLGLVGTLAKHRRLPRILNWD